MRNIFLLYILLLFCFSCQTNQNTEKTNTDKDSVVSVLDSAPLGVEGFIVKKLSEKSYLICEADTLWLQDPLIKVYEGSFDDGKALAILKCRMPVEGIGYEQFLDFYFIPKNGGLVTTEHGSYEITPYHLIVDGYRLSESSIRLKAYDQFSYQLKYCFDQNLSKYNYEYDFTFSPSVVSGLYEKVFRSETFQKITLGENMTEALNFRHDIKEDILGGLMRVTVIHMVRQVL